LKWTWRAFRSTVFGTEKLCDLNLFYALILGCKFTQTHYNVLINRKYIFFIGSKSYIYNIQGVKIMKIIWLVNNLRNILMSK